MIAGQIAIDIIVQPQLSSENPAQYKKMKVVKIAKQLKIVLTKL
jgi:hypothetical protein